jgi:hypothetical protein
MLTRTSNTLFKAFRAGVSLGSNTVSITALPNYNFWFGGRNNSGAGDSYTVHQIAFAFLGQGLTDVESGNLYTTVQNFQTTLSRQV